MGWSDKSLVLTSRWAAICLVYLQWDPKDCWQIISTFSCGAAELMREFTDI
jgi:hypothetical protein